MKLAMAQMQMSNDVDENLKKSLEFMKQAKAEGCDLIFFPEVQLSPFFPQYEKQDVQQYLIDEDSEIVGAFCDACKELSICASPNFYLRQGENTFDASLFIDASGKICGISKMVHILQAEKFYELDYYTPSNDGFKVFDTPFGKVGIVICFDRHIPESARACAKQGAELILIPTANMEGEPLVLFEYEVRVEALHNTCYIAMCNRVGTEGDCTFAGESMVADPFGALVYKAGPAQELCIVEIGMEAVKKARKAHPYLELLRPEFY